MDKSDELKETKTGGPAVRKFNGEKRKECAKALKVVTLVITLAATACLFSLPIIFHFVKEKQGEEQQQTGGLSPPANTSSNNSTSCSSEITWSRQPLNSCINTGYKYTGSICQPHISEWHKCAIGSGDILVNTTEVAHAELDAVVMQLQQLLASPCKEAAIPFLCRYYFPLKNCSTGDVYSVSQEECTYISSSVCAGPWKLATAFGYGDRLPKCSDLPHAVNLTTPQTVESLDAIKQFTNITCRDDFFLANGTLCLPTCSRFKSNTNAGVKALITSELLAVSIGLVACILVLAAAIPNYKNTLTFPSVFSLFLVFDYMIAAVMVIISATDRKGLYCVSDSLLDSLQSPTAFCSFSGAVFHYVLVSMTVWWFLHVTVFLYKMIFPFHARRMEGDKRMKLIFTVVVIAGIIVPFPAVIYSLSTDDYRVVRSPPSVCAPDGKVFFYSATVVIDLLIGTGVCFLIVIFWIIHMLYRHSFYTKNKDMSTTLSTAEKKVMIVFLSFIVFGVFTMAQTGITTADSDKLARGLVKYFNCESSGHIPGKCDRHEFEQYSHPYLLSVSYLLLGIIPLTILNFVLNVQSLKACVSKCLRPRGDTSSTYNVSQSTSSTGTHCSYKCDLKSDIELPVTLNSLNGNA